MPKLKNRNPKLGKLGNYAVVRCGGKIHYLGKHGTAESLAAYNRFCVELQSNPGFFLQSEETNPGFLVKELVAAFLDDAETTKGQQNYAHYRVVLIDFVTKLYGDGTFVDAFTPRCLKLVRDDMIQSRRFCRKMINDYTSRIVTMFQWGVSEEYVKPNTVAALRSVKSLPEGYPGTFDHPEREDVPEDVVRRTLPFLPPVLQAMVMLQWLTGCRPGEIFNMRVGDIDTSRGNGLWYYRPGSYKTAKHVGKIVFPLGKPEQELIAPYLVGKKPSDAVFSPRQAVQERNAERRKNRKSKPTPSQIKRDKARAAKPPSYSEFYNRHSYRQAIEYAVLQANRLSPDGEQIPNWTPYQLRNSAATVTELEDGLDEAQAKLGHKTANMTRRYSKAQLKIREKLARNRRNPFDTDGQEKDVA